MAIDKTRETENQELYSVILLLESTNVIIDTQDIEILYFVEDITMPCITGKMIFNDRVGIMEYGPFIGTEKISIQYGRREDREQIFEIFKIGAIRQGNTGNAVSDSLIELHFVDITFMPLTLKRYSRSFGSNQRYSDIVRHILVNMVSIDSKFTSIRQTVNRINNYIMPYWTPLQTIKFLAKRSKDNNGSGFLFFNNTQNGFKSNFKSYNFLLGKDNYKEKERYFFESESVDLENKVLEWWIDGIDKFSNKFIRGGKFLGYDFSTKSLLEENFDYSDGIRNSIILGRKSLYPDISDTANIHLYGDNSPDILKNRAYSEWAYRYNKQFILNIIVEGREDRFAGQLLEIEWPSLDRKNYYSKNLKGNYLVKTVTHSFGRDVGIPYKQRLVLIKNGYNQIDSRSLVKASKYNIFDEGSIINV